MRVRSVGTGARSLAVADHSRGDDVGTKADRALTATRVPRHAAPFGRPQVRPRSRANRYCRRRLAKEEGNMEQTGTGTTKGLLGEVRGDRAGRTPGNLHCGPAGSK